MPQIQTNIQRSFLPGSSWVYFKIYCGSTTANIILLQVLYPLIAQWLETSTIKSWFFIRYTDPDNHLRLRLWVPEKTNISTVLTAVEQNLAPYLEQDLIWKVQLDTYHRELERYGNSTMEVSETLFFQDSQTIVHALDLMEDSTLKLLFALRNIDQLLADFGCNTKEKLAFVQQNGTYFKTEFRADKSVNKQLDRKYRKHRAAIENFMTLTSHEDYAPLLGLLSEKSKALAPIVKFIKTHERNNTLDVPIPKLLASYVHMFLNRYYDNRQRLHEMVCYDFLIRYYRGVIGRLQTQS